SFYGTDNVIELTGVNTYDLSLLAIMHPEIGRKIIGALAKNSTVPSGESSPQTMAAPGAFDPDNGVFNTIRINNFEGEWYTTWDWRIHGGPNAWLAMAALHDYYNFKSGSSLKFAMERCLFLLSLEDTKDKGFRMGPKGQPSPNNDNEFYWNIKSSENNESIIYAFDMLYKVTGDPESKAAADRAYEWLKTMYDKEAHLFARGQSLQNGVWVTDPIELFASDTTTWAPIERMLEDPFFGATKADRLAEFERMVEATLTRTGVYEGGKLLGISYSKESAEKGAISVEWSSQLAVTFQRMADEYISLGMNDKADEYKKRSDDLLAVLRTFFKEKDGALVAPYAVDKTGYPVNVDTGHGWFTPSAEIALASDYFVFPEDDTDPRILQGPVKVRDITLAELRRLSEIKRELARREVPITFVTDNGVASIGGVEYVIINPANAVRAFSQKTIDDNTLMKAKPNEIVTAYGYRVSGSGTRQAPYVIGEEDSHSRSSGLWIFREGMTSRRLPVMNHYVRLTEKGYDDSAEKPLPTEQSATEGENTYRYVEDPTGKFIDHSTLTPDDKGNDR
ncbi:MAG TPA: hypothetical protein PLV52_06000, partial [Candidatus Omnitrophota bacterium]|nr:hypothetical protein [Candidatus Omnitrophota bacterium]